MTRAASTMILSTAASIFLNPSKRLNIKFNPPVLFLFLFFLGLQNANSIQGLSCSLAGYRIGNQPPQADLTHIRDIDFAVLVDILGTPAGSAGLQPFGADGADIRDVDLAIVVDI